MTELSIGVDFGKGQMDIPTIVPTLTRDEINHLASGGEITDEIVRKAVDHAVKRLEDDMPVFHTPYYKSNPRRWDHRPRRRK